MWNSMSYKERSLYNIFDTLTVSAVNNGISKSIIEEAKMLYKKLSELKISRGENRSGLIASSIYMSCKNNKVPRSAKEIAKIFNLKVTTMTRGCKKFQEIMKVNVDSTNAVDFIYRFCSKLNIDKAFRDVCKDVVVQADELGIVSENTPPSVAAGSIYLCNVLFSWNFTKKNMSEACEISQVTISKCYKKMFMYKKFLFSKETAEKYKLNLD
jgi:transcription initiation factor TFIIB